MQFIYRERSRPEKDHPAQLHAFRKLLDVHPGYGKPGALQVRLVMMGGSRNAEDAARVEKLRALARELGIEVRHLHPRVTLVTGVSMHGTGARPDYHQRIVHRDAQSTVQGKHWPQYHGR